MAGTNIPDVYAHGISVIVPVYNCSGTLRRTVSSVLSQTMRDFELILVDDGSTDGSSALCDDLASAHPEVRVFHKPNGGAASARNFGIDRAAGEYICFFDSDDEVMPDMLADLYASAEKYGSDLTVIGYKWIDSGRTVFEKRYKPAYFDGDHVRRNYDMFYDRGSEYSIYGYMFNKLYRTDVIRSNNLRVPALCRYEDEAFNLTYIDHISGVSFAESASYIYYVSSISENSRKYRKSYLDDMACVMKTCMETACAWNPENTRMREKLCRKLAVNIDFYIQMIVSDSSISLRSKLEMIGEAVKFFNTEVPDRGVKPDFLKYRLMLDGNVPALLAVHKLKRALSRLGFSSDK